MMREESSNIVAEVDHQRAARKTKDHRRGEEVTGDR